MLSFRDTITMANEPIPQYFQSFLGKPDPRVSNWFLLNSPVSLVTIFFGYFTTLFVCKKLMENREPFKMNGFLVVYNAFQVAYSGFVSYEILISAYLGNYKLACSPLDGSATGHAMRMARAFWLYYCSKVIDLADTVFFVLRKKKNQLTFLHCYHHATMIFNWYIGVLYLPGGQAFLSVLLNSIVHVIMYTYYMLSALGPRFRRYLWWKKYLTQLQLTQFIIVISHILYGLKNDCPAPKWLAYFTVIYLSSLVALFLNFYIKTYQKSKATQRLSYDTKAAGDWKSK